MDQECPSHWGTTQDGLEESGGADPSASVSSFEVLPDDANQVTSQGALDSLLTTPKIELANMGALQATPDIDRQEEGARTQAVHVVLEKAQSTALSMLSRLPTRDMVFIMSVTAVMAIIETDNKTHVGIFASAVALVSAIILYKSYGFIILIIIFGVFSSIAFVFHRTVNRIEDMERVSKMFEEADLDHGINNLTGDDLGPESMKNESFINQDVSDLQELMNIAASLKEPFEQEVLQPLTTAIGGEAEWLSNLKGEARAKEKMLNDYAGDARLLKDLLRGSVVCLTLAQLRLAWVRMDELAKAGLISIVQVKNRFRGDPAPGGYRDLNINVRFQNLVTEVQIHLKQYLHIKENFAHHAYEICRSLGLVGPLPSAANVTDLSLVPFGMRSLLCVLRCTLAFISFVYSFLFFLALLNADMFLTGASLALPFSIISLQAILMGCYSPCCCCCCPNRRVRWTERKITRVGLLYQKYCGLDGVYHAYKVCIVQMLTVLLQGTKLYGLAPKLTGSKGAFRVYLVAIMLNSIAPGLLMMSQNMRLQRDLWCVLDLALDIFYATFLLYDLPKSQAMVYRCNEGISGVLSYAACAVPLFRIGLALTVLESAWAKASAAPRGHTSAHDERRRLQPRMCAAFVIGLLMWTAAWANRAIGLQPCKVETGILQSCRTLGASAIGSYKTSNANLTYIEPFAFQNARYLVSLDLENNSITMLPRGAFDGLTHLRSLYLGSNKIERLQTGVFSGLTHLRRLYLDFNKIEKLQTGVFSGLTHLQYLHLNSNKIERLQTGVFSGLTHLQYLFLNSNKIERLHTGVFSGLTHLQYLYLNYNNIERLQAGVFSGLTHLQRLHLGSNEIERLQTGVFSGLTHLQYLDLSGNNFQELQTGVFSSLTQLHKLNLANCGINSDAIAKNLTRAVSYFKRLEVIDLASNKIAQDTMAELRRVLPDLCSIIVNY